MSSLMMAMGKSLPMLFFTASLVESNLPCAWIWSAVFSRCPFPESVINYQETR